MHSNHQTTQDEKESRSEAAPGLRGNRVKHQMCKMERGRVAAAGLNRANDRTQGVQTQSPWENTRCALDGEGEICLRWTELSKRSNTRCANPKPLGLIDTRRQASAHSRPQNLDKHETDKKRSERPVKKMAATRLDAQKQSTYADPKRNRRKGFKVKRHRRCRGIARRVRTEAGEGEEEEAEAWRRLVEEVANPPVPTTTALSLSRIQKVGNYVPEKLFIFTRIFLSMIL
ncbi:hypothetical protein U1Q18_018893 [Sarracenia purpurea var. burkii]